MASFPRQNAEHKLIVLVDSASYGFYRVGATRSWWNRAHPDLDRNDNGKDQEKYREHLISQYWKHLAQLTKKTGVQVKEMYLLRDCTCSEIWRKQIYPQYKEKRHQKPSDMGPDLKYLNSQVIDRYHKMLRIPGAEADDLVAVLSRYFQQTSTPSASTSSTHTSTSILIVSTDRDFQQLVTMETDVPVYQVYPKSWQLATAVPESERQKQLLIKILSGDSCDQISPCYPGCGPATAAQLASLAPVERVKRLRSVSPEAFRNYCLNRELIDLSMIPRSLVIQITKAMEKQIGDASDTTSIEPTASTTPDAPHTVQLGLCCLNTELRDKNIFCSRKPILKTIRTKGVQEVIDRCRLNCQDLIRMLKWNAQNGIRVFRISSELFPHYANPRLEAELRYSLDHFQPLLTQAGQLARQTGQRLTFHPGQYNVLATPNPDSFAKTVADLSMHAEIFDRMEMGPDSIMVIHGGGMYGDKEATKSRWAERFKELPRNVQERLVLENCEKCFSVKDCLEISDIIGNDPELPDFPSLPVVLDFHHFNCYIQLHPAEAEQFGPVESYYSKVLATWNKRCIKPKFHISSQAEGGRVGKHADFIDTIPDSFLRLPQDYSQSVDLMVEAKMKEQAIFDLYQKYPQLDLRLHEDSNTILNPLPRPIPTPKLSLPRPRVLLSQPTIKLPRPTIMIKPLTI